MKTFTCDHAQVVRHMTTNLSTWMLLKVVCLVCIVLSFHHSVYTFTRNDRPMPYSAGRSVRCFVKVTRMSDAWARISGKELPVSEQWCSQGSEAPHDCPHVFSSPFLSSPLLYPPLFLLSLLISTFPFPSFPAYSFLFLSSPFLFFISSHLHAFPSFLISSLPAAK